MFTSSTIQIQVESDTFKQLSLMAIAKGFRGVRSLSDSIIRKELEKFKIDNPSMFAVQIEQGSEPQ